MNEYKFRVWDEIEKRFWYFTLQEILERRMNYNGSWDMTILKSEKTQDTGLKDKNGKEIYVGDILKVTHPTTGTVRVGEVLHGSLGRIQIKGNGIHCAFNHISTFIWEIVGNKYENVELLEIE